MNEFDDIEKELHSLSLVPPSEDFCERIENALGDSGTVAMCHMPQSDEIQSSSSTGVYRYPLFFGFAALILLGFFLSPIILGSFSNDPVDKTAVNLQPSSLVDDGDSPLYGVSLDELDEFSGFPTDGWLNPTTEERFLKRVDEGVVNRKSGTPARQYRYHYIDETLWTHPATQTRILSTSPRQEVFLIDLELY
jgi:hypothetical protein